jgi:polyisoprenoid-binding protein YceI
MRRALLSAVLFAALATPVVASTWEIDPAHTSVQFAVRHLMVSTVRGNFTKVGGSAQVDEADVTGSSIQATIDASSIDTRNEKRDAHLRSPEFLDVAKFPSITFESKKVERVGAGKFTVTGDLTLHGVTKQVALDVVGSSEPMKDPFGNLRMGGMATTTIDRRDFGLTWNKALEAGGVVVGDEVEITIDVELTKKKEG